MRISVFLERLALSAVFALFASAAFADGPEFIQLAKPQPTDTPGKIEVIEFFWYGCPHCNSLEPIAHHGAVFDAIHKSKAGLRDDAQVAAWAVKRG